MKRTGTIFRITSREPYLRIPTELRYALRIAPTGRLSLFGHCSDATKDQQGQAITEQGSLGDLSKIAAPKPSCQIIASDQSRSSWGNSWSIGFSGVGVGILGQLNQILSLCGIYTRSIQAAEPPSLIPGAKPKSTIIASVEIEKDNPIVESDNLNFSRSLQYLIELALFTVGTQKRNNDAGELDLSIDIGQDSKDVLDYYIKRRIDLLRNCLDSFHLIGAGLIDTPKVEWVYPIGLPVGGGGALQLTLRRDSDSEPGSLMVDFADTKLSRTIWSKNDLHIGKWGGAEPKLPERWAVPIVDTVAQTICWHVFDPSVAVLVQFEVIVPANIIMHNFQTWIAACVSQYQGNILSFETNERLGGVPDFRNDKMGLSCRHRVTAVFHLRSPNESIEKNSTVSSSHGEDERKRTHFQDIRCIYRCLKNLQGRAVDAWKPDPAIPKQEPADWMARELAGCSSTANHGAKKETRTCSSILKLDGNAELPHRVYARLGRVHFGLGRRLSPRTNGCWGKDHIPPNPFVFTKPWDSTLYNGSDNFSDTSERRINIAKRLAGGICRSYLHNGGRQNVAVVGARRAGKTSMLQSVQSILESPHTHDLCRENELHLIGVSICAPVTPPQLFPTILSIEILKTIEDNAKYKEKFESLAKGEGFRKTISKWIRRLIVPGFGAGAAIYNFWSHGEGEPANAIALAGKAATNIVDGKIGEKPVLSELKETFEDSLLRQSMAISEGQKSQPNLLLSALESCQEILEKLQQSVISSQSSKMETPSSGSEQLNRSEGSKSKLGVVVFVDELSDSDHWGEEGGYSLWRYMLEEPKFSEVFRWVIASTKPISEISSHSAIVNLFRESNLPPLSSEECNDLIDRFSTFDTEGKNMNGEELTRTKEEAISKVNGDRMKSLSEHKDVSGSVTNERQDPDVSVRRDAGDIGEIRQILVTENLRQGIPWMTGRLPYLMQIVCHYMFTELVHRRHLPVATTRIGVECIRGRTLPRLAEYFERQWNELSPTAQDYVLSALDPYRGIEPIDILFDVNFRKRKLGWLPPGVERELVRSGLYAIGEKQPVVPLVAVWLLGKEQERPATQSHTMIRRTESTIN